MGNWMCSVQDEAHLAVVARDFCPFPDYSPSPLLNMLSVNSSLLLSEHYAAVQASLTPRQQQDFTRSLRSTFGREGKVSYGGVGIVALSLAVLFDTVARQVKGECVSDQEPIPGLFLKGPTGTYSPPVHTISEYLRLVPHIANNPTRMRDETDKYLLQLKHAGAVAVDSIFAAQQFDDPTGVNLMKCYMIGRWMALHLMRISNTTIAVVDYLPRTNNRKAPEIVYNLYCDLEEAGERFLAQLDSFNDRTKEAFKKCGYRRDDKTVIKGIMESEWLNTVLSMTISESEDEFKLAPLADFDLTASALGKGI